MLEIFYEKKDFFLLKEMEKIAPREKGKSPLESAVRCPYEASKKGIVE